MPLIGVPLFPSDVINTSLIRGVEELEGARHNNIPPPWGKSPTTVTANKKPFRISELVFLDDDSDNSAGKRFKVQAALLNRGKVSADDLGALSMTVTLGGKPIAILTVDSLSFRKGVNIVQMQGTLLSEDEEALSVLANSFVAKTPFKVMIRLGGANSGVRDELFLENVFSTALDGLQFPATLNEAAVPAPASGEEKSISTLLRAFALVSLRVNDDALFNGGELFDPELILGERSSSSEGWVSPIPPMPPIALQRRLSPERKQTKVVEKADRVAKKEQERVQRRLARHSRKRRRKLAADVAYALPSSNNNDGHNNNILTNLLGTIRNSVGSNSNSQRNSNLGRNDGVDASGGVAAAAGAAMTKTASVMSGVQNLISGVALAALDTLEAARGGAGQPPPVVVPVQPDPPVAVGARRGESDDRTTTFAQQHRALKPAIRWKNSPETIYRMLENDLLLAANMKVDGIALVGIWKPFRHLNVSAIRVIGELSARRQVIDGAEANLEWTPLGKLDLQGRENPLPSQGLDREECRSRLSGFDDGRQEFVGGFVQGKTDILRLDYAANLRVIPSAGLVEIIQDIVGGRMMEIKLSETFINGKIETDGVPPISLNQNEVIQIIQLPPLTEFYGMSKVVYTHISTRSPPSDLRINSISMGDTNEVTVRIEVDFISASVLSIEIGPLFLDWVYDNYHMGPLTVPRFALKNGLNRVEIYGGLYPGPKVMMKAASLFASLMSAPSMSVCVSGRSHWSDEERSKLSERPLNGLVNRFTESLAAACMDIPNPATARLTDALIPMVGQIMRALVERGRVQAAAAASSYNAAAS